MCLDWDMRSCIGNEISSCFLQIRSPTRRPATMTSSCSMFQRGSVIMVLSVTLVKTSNGQGTTFYLDAFGTIKLRRESPHAKQ